MSVKVAWLRQSFAIPTLLVLVVSLTACGGTKRAATTTSTHPSAHSDPFVATGDPLAVTKGMTKAQVRQTSGRPLITPASSLDRDCWFYELGKSKIPAYKSVRICFSNGRVSSIQPVLKDQQSG